MELEGTLLLERSPTRRWVSIIAIVIPVASVVIVAAWFIRAYVAPPSITIPSPMMIAAVPAPPAAPAPSPRAEPALVEQPTPQVMLKQAMIAPVAPPMLAATPPEPKPVPVTPPMIATLAVAPPNFNALSGNQATFTDAAPMAAHAMAPETVTVEMSEPLKGPVPLPRQKPHVSVAAMTDAVPLPRPRPVIEETPAPDVPAVNRHAIE